MAVLACFSRTISISVEGTKVFGSKGDKEPVIVVVSAMGGGSWS